MKTGMREGQPQQIYQIYYHDLSHGQILHGEDSRLADELLGKTILLCPLQNEVDCLPLLFLSIGPALLFMSRRREQIRSLARNPIDQTSRFR